MAPKQYLDFKGNEFHKKENYFFLNALSKNDTHVDRKLESCLYGLIGSGCILIFLFCVVSGLNYFPESNMGNQIKL